MIDRLCSSREFLLLLQHPSMASLGRYYAPLYVIICPHRVVGGCVSVHYKLTVIDGYFARQPFVRPFALRLHGIRGRTERLTQGHIVELIYYSRVRYQGNSQCLPPRFIRLFWGHTLAANVSKAGNYFLLLLLCGLFRGVDPLQRIL